MSRQFARNVGRISSIGLHYINLSSPSVTETGNGVANLHVHSNTYESLRIPVRGEIQTECHWAADVTWTPELRTFYVREFADDSARAVTLFDSVRSVSFIADSGKWGRNSERFGVGLGTGLSDCLFVRIDFDYDVYEYTTAREFGTILGVKW